MADGDMKFETDPETGDVIYSTQPPAQTPQTNAASNQVELVGRLSDETLATLAEKLTEGISHDQNAHDSQEKMHEGFLELLGLGPESKEDEVEDEGNDTSDSTLMLTALLRFQAKAYSTLLPSDDTAVRTKPAMHLDAIQEPEERKRIQKAAEAAGDRVERFYTEYLFERMPSYEEDTDLILHDMGLFGLGIRKVSTDRSHPLHPVCAEYVALEDLILSYDSRNMRTGRLSHRINMPLPELVRRMAMGIYRPVSLTPGLGAEVLSPVTEERDRILGLEDVDPDARHLVYEVYCELFLEEDEHPKKLARPYIVTIHAPTQEILSVQRNWDTSDKTEAPIEHFVGYTYHPGKNAVSAVGLGSILGNVTRALRRAQRRAFESAYLQNHPSGFKLAAFSVRDDATKVRKGQFMDVETPTDDIRKGLMAHPFTGPSAGLIQMHEKLENSGRELGGIASIDFAQLMKSGVAAGPAMAAFEESTEFQTSVHRRLYKAHRKELKLVHDRMRVVFGNREVLFNEGQEVLLPDDLRMVDVIPYMKPGQVSRQKMILEAQAIYDLSVDMPDVLDQRACAEEYLRALGKQNLDELMKPDPNDPENQPEPMDPVSEYSLLMIGQSIRAGIHQNHQAHIDTHISQLRMLTESDMPIEQGQAAAAALAAHVAEHHGMLMTIEIANRTGISVETFQNGIPPEMENQVAAGIAQATLQMERERAEARQDGDDSGEKLQIEHVKQQGAVQKETIKAEYEAREKASQRQHEKELAELKAAHERELQAAKDEAAMQREIEDNAAAIKIAGMKGTQTSPSATSGTKSGANSSSGAKATSGGS